MFDPLPSILSLALSCSLSLALALPPALSLSLSLAHTHTRARALWVAQYALRAYYVKCSLSTSLYFDVVGNQWCNSLNSLIWRLTKQVCCVVCCLYPFCKSGTTVQLLILPTVFWNGPLGMTNQHTLTFGTTLPNTRLSCSNSSLRART
jgi:hypothetical protein